MKIGVFDSGVGGVTVLNELTHRFRSEAFYYFGDTANVPYGTKSKNQIKLLVDSAATRMSEKKIDALVIACNTASSIAFENFKLGLPNVALIDVVEAGVQAILKTREKTTAGSTLILGTRATVKSKIYSKLLHAKRPELNIIEQECPLLVPIIEEGLLDHPILNLAVEEYVKPYQKQIPGVALLACTHYPWVKSTFEKLLPGWMIIDSAYAVANLIESKLNLVPTLPSAALPSVNWYFSDPEAVTPKLVSIDKAKLMTF